LQVDARGGTPNSSLGFFDRVFGKGRAARLAQSAELRGDLAYAVAGYVDAGLAEDAARVLLLRGDADSDPSARLVFFTQAVQLLPPDTEAGKRARRKRAELRIALATAGKHAAMGLGDTRESARELEAIGDYDRAAELYQQIGDKDGLARVLTAAGEIDKLELLLAGDSAQADAVRTARDGAEQIRSATSEGRRRQALDRAKTLASDYTQAAVHLHENARALPAIDFAELAAQLLRQRVDGPLIEFALGEPAAAKRFRALLGDDVTLGRSDATLTIAHTAISRKHLCVRRGPHGVEVLDLNTRNGTLLRGQRLAGPIPIHDGLELRLGGEVRIVVKPSTAFVDAVELETGGEHYVLPLGVLKLGAAGPNSAATHAASALIAELSMAYDGWIELARVQPEPLYQKSLTMTERVELLRGDTFSRTRDGATWLKVL
jgi:pSer/pThr/pTyr-binding forkhead associated (FHA) protein